MMTAMYCRQINRLKKTSYIIDNSLCQGQNKHFVHLGQGGCLWTWVPGSDSFGYNTGVAKQFNGSL